MWNLFSKITVSNDTNYQYYIYIYINIFTPYPVFQDCPNFRKNYVSISLVPPRTSHPILYSRNLPEILHR